MPITIFSSTERSVQAAAKCFRRSILFDRTILGIIGHKDASK